MAGFFSQSSMYAVADFTSNTSILSVANRIVSANQWLKAYPTSLGLKQTRTLKLEETPGGALSTLTKARWLSR